MLIYALIIFALVTACSVTLMHWLVPTRSQRRLQEVTGQVQRGNWMETVVQIAGPLSKLSIPEGKWENSPLRIRFINAGIRNPNAPVIFYAAKTALPLLVAGLTYLGLEITGNSLERNTLLLVLVVAATVGCYLPNFYVRRAGAVRKREIFENFPDAADLMLVCVEAGLGFDAAFVRVADEVAVQSAALSEEIHLTNLETRAGFTREQALRNLGLRTGVDEINTFASIVAQADKFGTSIGDSLRIFSDDLRHKRQIKAEILAAKLPTKMLFPLVLCIFPAISMVILGPAFVQVYRILLPMMGGSH